MERYKNLGQINTNTVEGRLLIAAMAKISGESQTDKTPDDILQQCHDLAEKIYKDADDIPLPEWEEPQTFDTLLTQLINKFSLENGSNTPDYILANYLVVCIENYNQTIRARDKWFNIDVWARND